ncbi:MAG: hypothetical protein KF887_00010 [Paracoccaceae bacterium]|nr:MAG: hypothetical protein KF887_00010 [Paracoccaceae bacterium]
MTPHRAAGLAAVLILVIGWSAAMAQTIPVRSGEHEGFSRLVLTLPQGTGWHLWRTDQGYALRLDRSARYDLAGVFRLIPRTRLAAIWAEPATGWLQLGLGCRCHATAFEFRPGILVIDLHDGPPPPGSVFETDKNGAVMAALTPRDAMRPRRRPAAWGADGAAAGYDWLDAMADRAGTPAEAQATAPIPSLPGEIAAPDALHEIRAALLAELGRGAARGVVDMRLPQERPLPRTAGLGDLPQLRIGDAGSPDGTGNRADPGNLTDAGRRCLPDTALDLAGWGDTQPVSLAIGPRVARTFGEFDRPDTDATASAVRYLLHIGFGAEARRLIEATGNQVPDAPLLRLLGHLVDGETPPQDLRSLEGMQTCDGAAALWSVLALPGPPGHAVARDAVLRTFSGLPLHLRRHVGPMLAERFLAQGDTETARSLREAILRAPDGATAATDLLGMEIGQAGGQAPDTATLAGLQAAPGPDGIRAVTLAIRTAATAGTAPDASTMTAAEAMLTEHRGTDLAAELARQLAAAHAMAGNLDRALQLAGRDAATVARVWDLVAHINDDGLFMAHAIRADIDLPSGVSAATDRAIAERLIALGFPDAALPWLAAARRTRGESRAADALLLARAHLAAGDPRAALRDLAGLESDEAAPLRDAAALRLALPVVPMAPGQSPVAETETVADATATARRARRAAQWEIVAIEDETSWSAAAALAGEPTIAGDGPLARGWALRDESGTARAILGALLAATQVPPGP